jgi:lysophospholipase L1-like esterase
MLAKNKSVIYGSILLNLILISFFSVWLMRKGGFSYLARKIPPNTVTITQIKKSKSKPQPKPQKSRLYYSRLELFQLLDSSLQPNTGIVFLGDSLTEMGEWNELLNNTLVKNRGISGDTTDDILARLNLITEIKPSKIFLMIGVNDLWQQKSNNNHILENYHTIFESIKTYTPSTKVYIQSMLPVNNTDFRIFKASNEDIIWLNQQIEKMVKKFNYQYIDLFSHFINNQGELDTHYTDDGVHLNAKGYIRWRDLVKNYVKEN